ncbi:MAG: hypothetical protein AAGL68_11510 [Pseudomonadota bacterium]
MLESVPADSLFLNEILSGLWRRSKAFKHKNLRVTAERILEKDGAQRIERLDISVDMRKRQRLTFALWQDRQVFVFVGHYKQDLGWLLEVHHTGRLMPEIDGRAFCDMIERLQSLTFEPDDRTEAKVLTFLKSKIATGPRAV